MPSTIDPSKEGTDGARWRLLCVRLPGKGASRHVCRRVEKAPARHLTPSPVGSGPIKYGLGLGVLRSILEKYPQIHRQRSKLGSSRAGEHPSPLSPDPSPVSPPADRREFSRAFPSCCLLERPRKSGTYGVSMQGEGEGRRSVGGLPGRSERTSEQGTFAGGA